MVKEKNVIHVVARGGWALTLIYGRGACGTKATKDAKI